jgi:hypothetical protein
MTRKIVVFLCTFSAGAIVGHFASLSMAAQLGIPVVAAADSHKPVIMTHLFVGPDKQTHSEQIELQFAPGKPADAYKIMPVTGGEIHRTPGGTFEDWHTTSRRQYVITLAGRGEMEIANGEKVPLAPGTIELIEDPTGKGHITRTTSTEERVALHLYLADAPSR